MSTVTNADQILVLHAGRVAEAGTHLELLELKGRYANMWKKQIRAQKAADVAAQAVAKAKALHDSATKRPADSDEQEQALSSGETSENEENTGYDGTAGKMAEDSQDTDSTLDGSLDENAETAETDNDSTPRNTPRNAA